MKRREILKYTAFVTGAAVGVDVEIDTVGLVDDRDDAFTGLAQTRRDDLVARGESGASIEHKKDQVGLTHRELHLLLHQQIHTVALIADAARIDHDVGPIAQPSDPVLAVTGESGLIGDHCVT